MSTRPARIEDARVIAEIHVAAWRLAYAHIFPAEFLDALSVDRRESAWVERLSAPPPQERTWVEEIGGRVVGWVQTVTAPGKADTELQALYVAPDHWRDGIGRALWAAAAAALHEDGGQTAWLWVLAGNARAIAFYEQAGFVAVPSVTEPVHRGGVTAWKLRYVHPGPLAIGQAA